MVTMKRVVGGAMQATAFPDTYEFIHVSFREMDGETETFLGGMEGELLDVEILPIPTACSQFAVILKGRRLEFMVTTETEQELLAQLCGRKEPRAIFYGRGKDGSGSPEFVFA